MSRVSTRATSPEYKSNALAGKCCLLTHFVTKGTAGENERTAQTALLYAEPERKDIVLQLEGVTLVAALLHQIRRGFAERWNNVATPLVYLIGCKKYIYIYIYLEELFSIGL